ncbi:hypothetical protein GCM10009786_04540 [Leucobacter alluvii]|uniref:Uncharacterized protein n=1 Tax=Leucobacter alluvii TaxID=340321 RepID=A0ABN3B391_9MICO
MATDRDKSAFEPVLLDLSHDDDYTVLIHVLEEYEGVMQNEADDERFREARGEADVIPSQESEYRALRDRARKLRLEIERQIDANGEARSGRQN